MSALEREQEVIENLTEVRKVVAELGQKNNVNQQKNVSQCLLIAMCRLV